MRINESGAGWPGARPVAGKKTGKCYHPGPGTSTRPGGLVTSRRRGANAGTTDWAGHGRAAVAFTAGAFRDRHLDAITCSAEDERMTREERETLIGETWLRIYAAHAHDHAAQIRLLREALRR